MMCAYMFKKTELMTMLQESLYLYLPSHERLHLETRSIFVTDCGYWDWVQMT